MGLSFPWKRLGRSARRVDRRNGVRHPYDRHDERRCVEFEDLIPATYTVRLVQGTIPSSLAQTYSKTPVLDLTTTQSVAEGQAALDVNFGFQERTLPVAGADLARLGTIAILLISVGIALRLSGYRPREDEA